MDFAVDLVEVFLAVGFLTTTDFFEAVFFVVVRTFAVVAELFLAVFFVVDLLVFEIFATITF